MKTDNELIAEFMGYVNKILVCNIYEHPKYFGMETMSMQYHSSWDWLMPVVEKIESTDPLGGIVIIQQGMCRITSRMLGDNSIKAQKDNYLLMGSKGKLKSTYEAVVEFIKWYNKNQIKL